MGILKNILKRIKLNESTLSTALGALVVVIIGVLIINYFRGINQSEITEVPPVSQGVQLVEEDGKLIPIGLPATYTVEAGDHLWKIAEKFYGSGYNWVDIAKENQLANPDKLLVGLELNIPKTEVIQPEETESTIFGESIETNTYTVVKGDHLWAIAVRAYADGYQWVKIARENNITNPDLIHPGNVLALPR